MIKEWKKTNGWFVWLVFGFMAGCATFKTYRATCQWLDRQINIDGQTDDWKGAQFFLEKEQLLLGFINDQDFLYLHFVVSNRSRVAQIIRQGLTIWIDATGKKKKHWGIRYPVGGALGRRQFPPMFGRPEATGKKEPPLKEERMEMPQELEIIKADKDEPERIDLLQAKKEGLVIQAKPEKGVLVYELKIPLKFSEKNRLAIGAEPGKTISLGFETGELKMERQSFFGPGGGIGRRPPFSGGFGPQGRMSGLEPGQEMVQPLKIWVIIQLSQEKTLREAKFLEVYSENY
ncbi:MAG: hypothetical protein N3B16_05135 [Candidatus Aminicenantes bacterium]|nr:hypothetical protein [Candidatus Aminicenantes bacterium]